MNRSDLTARKSLRITVGVTVHAEPQRLDATLRSLDTNTAHRIDVVLLPDGPDEASKVALSRLSSLPQLGTDEPQGSPACFNRLVKACDADVFVLLESGCQVGPGWLHHLLAALDADGRNGLAGPSTNRSWNEQVVFPHAGSSPTEIAQTARQAVRRFRSRTRALEPLYSLADFCYVVRREVVEAVGAADEGYGLGPCWEMDYNIRAARAGYRGVWACAAYVHRSPFTARRGRYEKRYFPASRRRYQDKFCALRLRGERGEYEPHCRGDDCEHFAPRELIEVRLPLDGGTGKRSAGRSVPDSYATARSRPLVSCIMPTHDRSEFVHQAIRYYQRQDYPERELIIVDDGCQDLARILPDDPTIRYQRLPRRRSIGAKRNHACQQARGEFVAHWDDDDWYSPTRLSAQIQPLLDGNADITALEAGVFFDLERWEFWRCSPRLHRKLFVHDVHGGTLAFKRTVWARWARYPDRSLAEDAEFLRRAIRRGARLIKLENEDLFVYVRHGANAWSFACGEYLAPGGWLRVDEPHCLRQDRTFYREMSSSAGPRRLPEKSFGGMESGQPAVTCIMPTADRRAFVPGSIDCFLRQDYSERELLILDDGSDEISDLIPVDDRIRYMRLGRRMNLGAKRNLACEEASGDIIVHWDDDDWSAPWRLRYQVSQLLQADADVCGLDRVVFYYPAGGACFEYSRRNRRKWLYGATLAYRKLAWRANRFAEVNIGEDNRFVWRFAPSKLLALAENSFFVAVIHDGNTSPKRTRGSSWRPCSVGRVEDLLGEDYARYSTQSETMAIVAGDYRRRRS